MKRKGTKSVKGRKSGCGAVRRAVAARKARRRRPAGKKKVRYQVTNWSEYNRSLIQRGSLTVWIDEDLAKCWEYRGPRKPGAPILYSDLAIECLLTLRSVYHMTLRGVQGFAESVFKMMGMELVVPNYTTLSRRAAKLSVSVVRSSGVPIRHVVLDATGLKVFGEGEWKVRKHGWSKRRTWRKLHLAVNHQTQEIEAVELTENSTHDFQAVRPLLDQVQRKIQSVSGDGAYDKRSVYETLAERGIEPVIPPQRNAKIWQHGNRQAAPLPRDESLRRIRAVGRKAWKEETGYHRRSLAETAIFRYKTIFGDHLASRFLPQQVTEVRICIKALNKMTRLGMPETKIKQAA